VEGLTENICQAQARSLPKAVELLWCQCLKRGFKSAAISANCAEGSFQVFDDLLREDISWGSLILA